MGEIKFRKKNREKKIRGTNSGNKSGKEITVKKFEEKNFEKKNSEKNSEKIC
jgi:hypothetical protein